MEHCDDAELTMTMPADEADEADEQEDLNIDETSLPRRILVRGNDERANIYFYPGDYVPEHSAVVTMVNALVAEGACAGADIERILMGVTTLYFNPLHQGRTDREYAVKRLIATIRAGANLAEPS